MKRISICLLIIFASVALQAQPLTRNEISTLKMKEDSMQAPALKIIRGINASDRFSADSAFTKTFVRALSVTNSFYYPFDSLITISKLYAPDSSFRIFTWQLVINENIIRQHGAIQMNIPDGSLKLFPLIDKSDIMQEPADSIADNRGWMGAIYYKIILNTYNGKKYYTLLGYDENNIRSTRKIIDILQFENNKPVFGAKIFNFPNGNVYTRNKVRYIMEFSKDASPTLNYDEEMKVIVMEHLISKTNEPNKKWTMVPDGDYEGFKWRNGYWVHEDKLFNEITPEGKPPVPEPLQMPSKIPPKE